MTDQPGNSSLQAQFRQAYLFHQNGKLTEAKSGYERIIIEDPEHFNALHFLGLIYFQLGAIVKSIGLITRAIGINPEDASAYVNRGISLMRLTKAQLHDRDFARAACHCFLRIRNGSRQTHSIPAQGKSI